jgi:hypothetical protein
MRRAVRGGEGSWSVCVDALAYVELGWGGKGGGEEGRPHVHGVVSEAVSSRDGGGVGSSTSGVRRSSTALWPIVRMGDDTAMTD